MIFSFRRLKGGTGGSALGGASNALVGTSGSLSLGAATAAAHVALTGGGSSRVTSSGVELRELRRHNYKASVSVLSHLNKGNSASPYVSIAGGHRQRSRAHRAMNMGQKISSESTHLFMSILIRFSSPTVCGRRPSLPRTPHPSLITIIRIVLSFSIILFRTVLVSSTFISAQPLQFLFSPRHTCVQTISAH